MFICVNLWLIISFEDMPVHNKIGNNRTPRHVIYLALTIGDQVEFYELNLLVGLAVIGIIGCIGPEKCLDLGNPRIEKLSGIIITTARVTQCTCYNQWLAASAEIHADNTVAAGEADELNLRQAGLGEDLNLRAE